MYEDHSGLLLASFPGFLTPKTEGGEGLLHLPYMAGEGLRDGASRVNKDPGGVSPRDVQPQSVQ